MTDYYKPGTVAAIRCADGDEFRAVKDDKGWASLAPEIGWVADHEVTAVRPLIVLDLVAVQATVAKLRKAAELSQTHPFVKRCMLDLAVEINKQSRVARIPEPEWGMQVVAATADDDTRRRFVRHGTTSLFRWTDGKGPTREWPALLDPAPTPEGVDQ